MDAAGTMTAGLVIASTVNGNGNISAQPLETLPEDD